MSNNGATIRRAPRKETNFTIVSKDITENTHLSWQARGLLVYLLGKFDNWQVNVAHLQKETCNARKKTGRDGIYAILEELLEVGYLQRENLRADDGAFLGVQYVVHEVPVPAEERTLKQSRAAANDEAAPAPHTDLPDTDLPDTAEPDTASPDTANPPLIRNEYLPSNDLVTRTDLTKPAAAEKSAELQMLERNWALGVEQPEGLSNEDWMALLTIRKKKRLLLTQKAMRLMESESARANLTLVQGIEFALERGWAAFAYSYWLNTVGNEMEARQRVANGGARFTPRTDAVAAAVQSVESFDDGSIF